MFASLLRANTITPQPPVGAAYANGSLDLSVTVPGIKDPIVVNVAIDPATVKTAAQKAEAIYKALYAKNIPNLGYQGQTTVTAAGSTIAVTGDNTAEGNVVVADLGLSLPGTPAFASLGFTGTLDPTGTDGNPSVFTASFGVDSTTFSSASVSYNQLTAPTDNALATALYNQLLAGLSANLQADLSLNLSTDTITFDFPVGSGAYFVQNSTTSADTSEFSNVSSTAAPEPFTCFSLGTGLLLLGACRFRRSRPDSREDVGRGRN
jgi:hypothetical protein